MNNFEFKKIISDLTCAINTFILNCILTLLIIGVAAHLSFAKNINSATTNVTMSIRGILYQDTGGVYIKGKSDKKMSFEIVPVTNILTEDLILKQNTFVELIGKIEVQKNKPNVFIVKSIRSLNKAEVQDLNQ